MTHQVLSDRDIMLAVINQFCETGSPEVGALRMYEHIVPLGRAIEAALLAKLGQAPAPHGWTPAGERAPRDGQAVAVFDPDNPVQQVWPAQYDEGNRSFTCNGGWFEANEVSHWVPLPAAPADVSNPAPKIDTSAPLVDSIDMLGPLPAWWPDTPAKLRDFMRGNYGALAFGSPLGAPHEGDEYLASAHDLLSAFSWLEEEARELAGWRQAVDQELTTLQSTADSYATPREAVRALVDWYVAAATDPVLQGAPLNWSRAPEFTIWGGGMMVCELPIGPDATASVYIDAPDIPDFLALYCLIRRDGAAS